jgi:hypothetical protein
VNIKTHIYFCTHARRYFHSRCLEICKREGNSRMLSHGNMVVFYSARALSWQKQNTEKLSACLAKKTVHMLVFNVIFYMVAVLSKNVSS